MKVTLIGGINNGKRINKPKGDIVEIAFFDDPNISRERYSARLFCSEESSFILWVQEHVSTDEAIEIILKDYAVKVKSDF